MKGPSTGKKGAKSVPSAGERPSFIMGSRPAALRAPLPGAALKIKPQPASTRDYGKPPAGEGVGTVGEGSMPT